MNKLVLIPIVLFAACTVAAGESVEATPEAQDRLATALAGRTAGPSVSCVRTQDVRGNRIIDERTILFEGRGSTDYLNRTAGACAGMREWHALRLRTVGTQMCQGETVVAFDPTSGLERGGCALGEFTPYRREG